MTKVEEIERISWAHFREGASVRELARRLHKSRNTIRRALRDVGPWERLTLPPALVEVVVPAGDPSQYSRLLEAVGRAPSPPNCASRATPRGCACP